MMNVEALVTKIRSDLDDLLDDPYSIEITRGYFSGLKIGDCSFCNCKTKVPMIGSVNGHPIKICRKCYQNLKNYFKKTRGVGKRRKDKKKRKRYDKTRTNTK